MMLINQQLKCIFIQYLLKYEELQHRLYVTFDRVNWAWSFVISGRYSHLLALSIYDFIWILFTLVGSEINALKEIANLVFSLRLILLFIAFQYVGRKACKTNLKAIKYTIFINVKALVTFIFLFDVAVVSTLLPALNVIQFLMWWIPVAWRGSLFERLPTVSKRSIFNLALMIIVHLGISRRF